MRQLEESVAHLHELSGGKVDTVLLPTGETVLLQPAQAKGIENETQIGRLIETLKQAEKSIRHSESRYRLAAKQLTGIQRNHQRFLDFSQEIICTLDANGYITKINPACETSWGYKPEELIGTKNIDYIMAEDKAKTKRMAEKIMAGHVTRDFDTRYVRKNGTTAEMMWSANWSEADQTMFCVARDLTKSEEAIRSLRRNEAMLHNAQRIARFGSWEIDLTSPTGVSESPFYWSNEVFRILGYEPGQIAVSKENFLHAVHPEDRQQVQEALDKATRLSIGYSLDHRVILPDGSVRHVHEVAQVFNDGQTSRATKIVGIIQDITERKAFEEKLAEQASLLDQASDAILLKDLESTIVFWNKGAERLYGWTSAEAIGRKTTDFLFADPEKLNEVVQEVMEKGEWSGESEQVTKTGGNLIVASRWTLLRDAGGRPKSYLIFNSDVTERKKIEAQLLRSQRTESIGTLAGGIAHDLNNMLAPILLGTAFLKGEECSEEILEVVNDIEVSARRGADLVKQVLSFARGANGLRLSVHLADVMKDVVSIINKTFSKNIQLKIDIAPDLWTIESDPTQLNQVLLNICVNARDAMPDGGTLTISATNFLVDEQYVAMSPGIVVGRYVLIQIADTGCGIPAEKLDRIFEPFFTTKEVGKGTGLGLATTLGIIRSHKGFMNVSSAVGKGTTFTIHLPAQSDTEDATPAGEVAVDLPRGNGEWILLVDDEAPILKATGKTLRAYGYQVLTAGNGAKAVAVFAQHKKDVSLVLTDMMMPVMDGPAAIRALWRIDPKLKIIGASGLGSAGGMGKARQAGVKHFLNKPYAASALLNTIRSCISEGTN